MNGALIIGLCGLCFIVGAVLGGGSRPQPILFLQPVVTAPAGEALDYGPYIDAHYDRERSIITF